VTAEDLRDIDLDPYVAKDGREYVVLEIKGCDRGPPLLVEKGKWCTPSDEHIPLKTYLSMLAQQDGKEIVMVDAIDGRTFPRYQCATPKECWQETWLAIHNLFLEMRSAYRFLRGGKNAPNLWFGMTARLVQFDPLFRHTVAAQREENRYVSNYARSPQPGQAPPPSQREAMQREAVYNARREREDAFPFTRQPHPRSEANTWRYEPGGAPARYPPSYDLGPEAVGRRGYPGPPGPPGWSPFPGDPRGPDPREWERMAGPPGWSPFPGDPRGPDPREWERMPVARSEDRWRDNRWP
jgi:hypothetical protein